GRRPLNAEPHVVLIAAGRIRAADHDELRALERPVGDTLGDVVDDFLAVVRELGAVVLEVGLRGRDAAVLDERRIEVDDRVAPVAVVQLLSVDRLLDGLVLLRATGERERGQESTDHVCLQCVGVRREAPSRGKTSRRTLAKRRTPSPIRSSDTFENESRIAPGTTTVA